MNNILNKKRIKNLWSLVKGRKLALLLTLSMVLITMTLLLASCGKVAEADKVSGAIDTDTSQEQTEIDDQGELKKTSEEAVAGSTASSEDIKQLDQNEGQGTTKEKNSPDQPEKSSLKTSGQPQASTGTATQPSLATTPQAQPSTSAAQSAPAAKPTIQLSITFPKEVGVGDISQSITIEEGQTVLEALVAFGKANGVPVVYSGSKSMGYVEGVNGCFEFDHGSESGWIYSVNGSKPQKSSGAYKLQDGDKVVWKYVYSMEEL